MDDHNHLASLIPWYAAGTLGEDERDKVEVHLETCAGCRDRLDHARGLAQVATGPLGADDLLDHPPASLLADYAERPAELDPESAAWVRSHVASCAPCEEVLPIVRQLAATAEASPAHEASPAAATAALGGPIRRLWRSLGATVLRPAAALAYLLLLLLSYPVYRQALAPDHGPGPADPGPAVEVLSPAIRVFGELSFRAGPGEESEEPPLVLPIRAEPSSPLHLELHTELDPGLLERPGISLSLEILEGDEALWSQSIETTVLDPAGIMTVLLPTEPLDPSTVYRMVLRVDAPTEPTHDQVVFRRAFRVEPDH